MSCRLRYNAALLILFAFLAQTLFPLGAAVKGGSGLPSSLCSTLHGPDGGQDAPKTGGKKPCSYCVAGLQNLAPSLVLAAAASTTEAGLFLWTAHLPATALPGSTSPRGPPSFS